MKFKQFVRPDIISVVQRFPVCVLACVAIWGIRISGAEPFFGYQTSEFTWVFVAAFALAGTVHLITEERKLALVWRLMLPLLAGLAPLVMLLFEKTLQPVDWLLICGAILLLLAAQALWQNRSQESLWLFNARLAIAAGIAVVFGLLFWGVLESIYALWQFLFEVPDKPRLTERFLETSLFLVGPLCGLALVPKDVTEEISLSIDAPNWVERGLSIILNLLLVPATVIIAALLHIIAFKALIEGGLPQGRIGFSVIGFVSAGMATFLIAQPWRQVGSKWLRGFLRAWPWMTIIPVMLFAWAIYERVSQYGWTTSRYALVLLALWLAASAVYLIIKGARLRAEVIITGLSALLIAASFGPWGAKGFSIADQYRRLEEMLTKYELLDDNGRFRANSNALLKLNANRSDLDATRSIIRYFSAQEKFSELARIFPDIALERPSWQETQSLIDSIELKQKCHQIDLNQGSRRFQFDFDAAFELISSVEIIKTIIPARPIEGFKFELDRRQASLSIHSLPQDETWTFSFNRLKAVTATANPNSKHRFDLQGSNGSLLIMVINHGQIGLCENTGLGIDHMRFILLRPLPR